MKKITFLQYFLLLFASISVLFSTETRAQFVRKPDFATEKERRAQYALDDWISHAKSNRFSKMAVGDYYIYFGTLDGGILRYQFIENYWDYPFTTSNGLPENTIIDLAYDQTTSFLWAKTPNDVAFFNPASAEWTRKSENEYWPYEFPTEENNDETTPRNTDSVTKNRFFSRDALLSLPTFFANGAYSILEDWVLLDEITFDEYQITGYLRDRYDRIWFQVDGFGIGQGELFTQRADFYRVGLPDFSPRAIEYQKDDLWFGGIGEPNQGTKAIALWPFDSAEWTYFQARRISNLPNDNVLSILADGDSVWFATEFGVTLYDSGKDRWKNYSTREGVTNNLVYDLAILNDDLYAATEQGITRISLLTGRVQRIKDPRFTNLPFYRMALQGDTLWAVSLRGIFRFAPDFQKWEFVPSRAAVQDLNVTAVGTYDQEVWFAAPGGIFMFDLKMNQWQSFPQVSFDVSAPYSDIKVNDETVWVATADGLLKYDKTRLSWRLFTTDDGLLNNSCHQLLLDGDHIWIVNGAGVTQFFWNSPQRSD